MFDTYSFSDLFVWQDTSGGVSIQEFPPIRCLQVNTRQSVVMGVDLNDSTQPVEFVVTTSTGRSIKVSFKSAVGEIIRAVLMPEHLFNSERNKLKGVNEYTADISFHSG